VHIKVTRRARRHKVGVAHMLEVILSVEPTLVEADAAADARLVWIGEDSSGRTVRIVAVILDDEQELLVIHAMPDYRGTF
jgi:hypothetical protein